MPLKLNEKVLFKNNNKWQLGTVVEICKEPRSYRIQSVDGRIYRRNSIHIRRYFEKQINNTNHHTETNTPETQVAQERRKVTRSGRAY